MIYLSYNNTLIICIIIIRLLFIDKLDFEFVDFYVRVDDCTDFILDAASLTKVYYPNWKSEAINNIAKYRMGGITIK